MDFTSEKSNNQWALAFCQLTSLNALRYNLGMNLTLISEAIYVMGKCWECDETEVH